MLIPIITHNLKGTGEDCLYLDLENPSPEGIPAPVNADTFGGKFPSEYIGKNE